MLLPLNFIPALQARWLAMPRRLRYWLTLLGPMLLLVPGRLLVDMQWSVGRLVFSLLLYWVFALLLARWPAVLAALMSEALLRQVSQIKEAQTGEPLLARDLLEVSQGMAMSSYIVPLMVLCGLTLLAAVVAGWRLRPPRSRRHWLQAGGLAALLPALLLVHGVVHGYPGRMLKRTLQELGIVYHEYNYRQNVRANGLLAHLFQTAESVKAPAAGPHDFYASQQPLPLAPGQPDVVMILCEGCFTTFDQRMPTVMRELEQRGFAPFKLLSPVYGGGTAEAEFEVLTGLSSAVLPGIDYQVHASDLRPDARTLVSRFRDAGYLTTGMHNFYANFWRRNEIYPRIGFEQTRFVERMPWRTRGWPQDALLYDAALQAYAGAPPQRPQFMFLITVRTHGAFYHRGQDYGIGDYKHRLGEAMADMQAFLAQIEQLAAQRQRPLAVVVFGDHKPSLTGAFVRYGVLPPSLFSATGPHNDDFRFVLRMNAEQWLARAQSSAYVRLPDAAATRALAQRLDDRPMFCLPAELAGLTPATDPFWPAVHALCQRPQGELVKPDPAAWRKVFPLPLYGERLY
ncbi:LTA synthase family protein [Chitinilyticum litopenaei]|uniref:LTA synthase family protein n=1 Tax=Chitinilyticum litopenaei TaxID=1121276 RepID=UPI000429B635|nr:LTA synthase family protein [Chitinilyticum litopenaei]